MQSTRHAAYLLVGRLLTALLVAVAAGCASPAKFEPASPGQSLPPYEGEVRVLQNLPPSDQYTRVGVVTIEGVLLTKEEDMVRLLKEKAAKQGADAVVMQSALKVIKNPDGSTTKRLAAWAIRLAR